MSSALPTAHELNCKRRQRASRALRAHQDGRLDGVVSMQEVVTDLLADLMHLQNLFAASDLDVEIAWGNARRLYKRERDDEADEKAAGVVVLPNGGAQ